MNERLKKLAEEAFFDESTSGPGQKMYMFGEQKMQKFAELIVQECVQTLIDNTPDRWPHESAEEDWDKGYDRAMRDCVHHIQEHFGSGE